MHPDHIDVGAAVPDMGNHLIDSKSPELVTKGTIFTHTFIFGAYDGHVSFYEPMITRAYLEPARPVRADQATAGMANRRLLSDHLLHPVSGRG